MTHKKLVAISEFVGLEFVLIELSADKREISFTTKTGERFKMLHHHQCCEDVYLEEIYGEVEWLVNSPILEAEERTNSGFEESKISYSSYTWTFYHLATLKGAVTLRWYGTSTGNYSEEVEIFQE